MAATSTMVPLGTPAPDFALPDTEGVLRSPEETQDRPLLVVFMCNHCPYVRHISSQLATVAGELMEQGITVIGINSNDPEAYPDDDLESMRREVERVGYPFPYTVDESQEVAKAYGAACTPDFFLHDHHRRLYYRGQFDETRPGSDAPPTGADLLAAAQALLRGDPPPEPQFPSMGCGIKWRPGNEPVTEP